MINNKNKNNRYIIVIIVLLLLLIIMISVRMPLQDGSYLKESLLKLCAFVRLRNLHESMTS